MKKFLLSLLTLLMVGMAASAAYVKVSFTDGSELDLTKKYIIVCESKNVAMCNAAKSSALEKADVTIANNRIESIDGKDVAILTFAKSGNNYTIKNAEGKYLKPGTGKNQLSWDASSATVILKDGKIYGDDAKSTRYIQYNANSGSSGERFAAYTGTQKDVCLYAEEGDPANTTVTVDNINTTYAPELTLTPKFSQSELGTITYEPVGDAGVVDANLNVLKAGEQTVKATWTATTYKNTSAEFTVTIAKANPTLAYSESECTVFDNDAAPALPTLSNPANLSVTYTSSNTDVADVTIDNEIIILGTGKATIKAEFAGNDCYNAASAQYTLTVLDGNKVATPTFSLAAGTYAPLTTVTINTETDGATIYYALDQNETCEKSSICNEYVAGIGCTFFEEGTWYLHTYAAKEGQTDSEIATICYVIERTKADFRFTKESETVALNENAIYAPEIKGYNLGGVTYTIDDPSVLRQVSTDYNAAPKFIILKEGNAKITATLDNMTYQNATSTINVAVSATKTTTFDFTTIDEDGKVYGYATNPSTYDTDVTLTNDEGAVVTTTQSGKGGVRFWNNNKGTTWRLYDPVTITIKAPETKFIAKVSFTAEEGITKIGSSNCTYNSKDKVWTPNEVSSCTSAVFNITGSVQLTSITIEYFDAIVRDDYEMSFAEEAYTIYNTQDLPSATINAEGVTVKYLLNGKEYKAGDKLTRGNYTLVAYSELSETHNRAYASTRVQIWDNPNFDILKMHYSVYGAGALATYEKYETAGIIDGKAEFGEKQISAFENIATEDGTIACGEVFFSSANYGENEQYTSWENFGENNFILTPTNGDETLAGTTDDYHALTIYQPGEIKDFSRRVDCFDVPGAKIYSIEVIGLDTPTPTVQFKYNGVVTDVENVVVSDDAEVEYYNLNGIRVSNPENGIFIRRQGSKVSKVAF